MQYAIIDNTGTVINTIEWDGTTDWEPRPDHIAIPLLEGGIGWTFADGTFHPPAEPEQVK